LREPADVLPEYVTWLQALPGKPVFVAYPAAYDFMFVYWYLIRFAGESPFSHSALDIKSIYRDQWVMQLGAQLSVRPRLRLRAGYALAQSPIDPSVGTSVAGIPVPGGVPAVKYLQAQFAVVNEHRLSIGMGVRDVMPGLDFDILAGGMFSASAQLGDFTSTSLNSYWIGAGLTWRFGRGRLGGS
jgi:hypothetical protein